MPRENFKRGAKTRKNSVRTNHTFFREARHPFVYPARQRLQHISPISDLPESRSVIGVFSRPANEMDRGSQSGDK